MNCICKSAIQEQCSENSTAECHSSVKFNPQHAFTGREEGQHDAYKHITQV